MKTYIWNCLHCGWHHETTSLADHYWIGSEWHGCGRVLTESVVEQLALFELDA